MRRKKNEISVKRIVKTGIQVGTVMAKGTLTLGVGVASLFEPGWRKTARRKKQHQTHIAMVEKAEREGVDARSGTRRQLKERIKVEKIEFKKQRVTIAREEPTAEIAREVRPARASEARIASSTRSSWS